VNLILFHAIIQLDAGPHHQAGSMRKIKIDSVRQEFPHPLLSNTIYMVSWECVAAAVARVTSAG
jgi:hypothetical protein